MNKIYLVSLLSMLVSQDPPIEFSFEQSSQQAFYFIKDATIEGVQLEVDDWVATLKMALIIV